ncbi:MAG TPA: voltage-gated chloride channel protein [Treponema sp.]|nr:voltage-gated chloride channel protein [Treponema sp.]
MKPYLKFLISRAELLILSALTGVLTGIACIVFGRVLILAGDFRNSHFFQLVPFLGVAGFAIAAVYRKWGGESIKGMTLVFETEWNRKKRIPRRTIPLIIVSTWLTHLFGGSAGRESVGVQVGADIGFNLGRQVHNLQFSRTLLMAGIAAGFSGLFGTPLAAVFFALEVIVAGVLNYEALIPATVAALAASAVAQAGGLKPERFPLAVQLSYTPVTYVKLVVLALIFSLVGQLFSWSLKKFRGIFQNLLDDTRLRTLYAGFFISLSSILLFQGRYSGLGDNLVEAAFDGGTIYAFDWILKLLLTVITLSAGFQGGELMPLFAIGAPLGFILGAPLGLPPTFCAALGYVAVFAGATNTFLCPFILGCEVFGYDYMFVFFLVCGISRIMNGNRSIYVYQKHVVWDPGSILK